MNGRTALVAAAALSLAAALVTAPTAPARAAGDSWSSPVTTLAPAPTDGAVIAVAPSGETTAAWVAGGAAVTATRSPVAGAWTDAVVSPTGVAVERVAVATGADGSLIVAFAGDQGGTPVLQARVRRPGGSLGPPTPIDQTTIGPAGPAPTLDADIGADGTVTLAWITATGALRGAVLPATGAWGPASTIATDVLRADAVTAGAAGAPARPTVLLTRDTAGDESGPLLAEQRADGTWSTTPLAGGASSGAVAAASGGTVLAAWVDEDASPPRLRSAAIAPGQPPAIVPVSPADETAGGPALSVRPDGSAVLAWTRAADDAGSAPWTVGLVERGTGTWTAPSRVPGLAAASATSTPLLGAADGGRTAVAVPAGAGLSVSIRTGATWGTPVAFTDLRPDGAHLVVAPDGQATLLALTTASSALVATATPLPAPVNLGAPTVTGTLAVGQAVSCDPGSWTRAVGRTYAWLRNDSAAAGRTDATYLVGPDDAGTRLRCRVTASNAGGSAEATSAAAEVPGPPVPAGVPVLSEPVRVSEPVTCQVPGFSPSPATLDYQWLRDDEALADGTGATFTPRAAALGKALRCRVTATGAGGSTTVTSDPRTVAEGARLASVARPRIEGVARVGRPVVCRPGTWQPQQTAVEVRWLLRGRPLRGAVAQRLRVPALARGGRLACRVVAERGGHPSGRATSPRVRVRGSR